MARKALAIMTIILGASISLLYLYYAPSHVTLTIADPPQTHYSGNVTAIYVTLSEIDIHSAGSDNNTGWHTLTRSVMLNLMSILSAAKLLGTTSLSPAKYDQLRFFANRAVITINGSNTTYTIPSDGQGGTMVVIPNGGFHIYGGQSLTVQLDLSFNNNAIMNNQSKILTPVATASVIT